MKRFRFDATKIERELTPKTPLKEYIRERIKQTHNTKVFFSEEGLKTIHELVEGAIKQYLDEMIGAIMILLKASRRKTISSRLMDFVKEIVK